MGAAARRCANSHSRTWITDRFAHTHTAKQINRCRRQFDCQSLHSGIWKYRFIESIMYDARKHFATNHINCTLRKRWLSFFSTLLILCLFACSLTHSTYLYKVLGHRPMSIALRLINVLKLSPAFSSRTHVPTIFLCKLQMVLMTLNNEQRVWTCRCAEYYKKM